MKLTITPKPKPNVGDLKAVTKFLLLPKKIGNQWRWLERAIIIQSYQRVWRCGPDTLPPYQTNMWVDLMWGERTTDLSEQTNHLQLKERNEPTN